MADETSAKVVYFVLHGQSEDNVAPVFQPPESPLSAVGRHQAARIAARVATRAFDVLLASPYRRAYETAAVISQVTGKLPERFCRKSWRVGWKPRHGTIPSA